MSGFRAGFQEHWAAHLARQMADRIGAALTTTEEAERRACLADALDLGREARLRIESGTTDDDAEREGLRHLAEALDRVLAALNAVDITYRPLIQEAYAHAASAARCLGRAGMA